MSVDLSQFHQTFIEESIEGLDVMERALMALDLKNPDAELINSIFRAAHSIKGGGATFGFTALAEFTHVLETLLDQIRAGKRKLHAENVNLLLQSVDAMRAMLHGIKDKKNQRTETAKQLQAEFQRMLDLPQHEAQILSGTAAGRQTWRIDFIPGRDILKTGNDPLRIFAALSELGSLQVAADTTACPSLRELDPENLHLSWQLMLSTEKSRADILETFDWVLEESQVELTQLVTSAPPTSGSVLQHSGTAAQSNTAPAAAPQAETLAESSNTDKKSPTHESSSIRVGVDKIDSLINMVGELVITQSMLGQLGADFQANKLPKLLEGLAQLEQNTRELQESVMRIRMLPISFAFSRFPRMVRDLSQQLGKQVQLELHGEQTELDKTVMEKIGDPLVHLVRNAVDHGIEMPAQRLAAGKPATGRVLLNAFHQSGNVIIEISDDGKGLDRDAIVRKALERGLVAQNEVATLTDEQIFELIFLPGFSTAAQVSEVSGRGVGMDVVRRNIAALNGTVELQSRLGAGSKIRICLPLTLAILDGQLVRAGDNIYVFPLVSIVESMRCRANNISQVGSGARVFRLREEYVPIIELNQVLGLGAQYQNIDEALMVVVELEGHKVGVVVDDLLAQQQVVIKSLEQNYKRVEGISGATILGDGTVALILDIGGLVRLAGENVTQAVAPAVVDHGLLRKRA